MLALIQQATGEMGLGPPTYVAGNTSDDTIQWLALLNSVGYELIREYEWQALCTEYRFNTAYTATTGTISNGSAVITGIPSTTGLTTAYMVVGAGIPADTYILSVDSGTQVTMTQPATDAGTAQVITFCKTKYAFPSDYDRPIDRTQWDKTKHWQMLGPLTAQKWQQLKSGIISQGPRISFRQLGNTFQIWPPVTSSEYLGFEYVSSNWAATSGGTAKGSFTIDTDTCIFPDRLMVLGLKLKYNQAKNFDTTAVQQDYSAHLSIAKAADGGGRTLSMVPRAYNRLIDFSNLPESGFGPQ
jgi:hypothetical protein